jgi:hypothetical protein
MIPIFIITCDRIEALRQAMKSYEKGIGTPFEPVICDNGSTFPGMIKHLALLEQGGIRVYRLGQKTRPAELNEIATTIKKHMEGNDSLYYIVTDCDIALYNARQDILEFYSYLMEKDKYLPVVGPMLEIYNIPNTYPLKQEVIKRHQYQFWNKPGDMVNYQNNQYRIQRALIDTTFGMYRRDFPFQRLRKGIRTYKPYSALHLDWYVDPNNMTEDQRYYAEHCSSRISTWSKIL